MLKPVHTRNLLKIYYRSMCGMGKMEEDMKIKEFMKYVAAPIVSMIFLMALFRPLCIHNGECNYLMLWLFMGIPIGFHRLFIWIIPKGYDFVGIMGILLLNLLIAGVVGGVILTYRLLIAVVYLAEAMAAGMLHIVKIGCKER